MDVPADAIRETWESIYEKTVQLADLIEKHCQASGERFDFMLVVPRSAYYPANIVSRRLGFDALHLLHASVSSYQDDSNQRMVEFQTGQLPAPEQVSGKNILIIDEVCDTGQTLDYLYKYLKESGAALVRSGVLHFKPDRSQTGFKPDWTIETTNKWIIYPWELHEKTGAQSIMRKK